MLLMKHSLFQRIILVKNVFFSRTHATWWWLPPSRQQGRFKVALLKNTHSTTGTCQTLLHFTRIPGRPTSIATTRNHENLL